MGKYVFGSDGIENYIVAVNDSARRILQKEKRVWPVATPPVYPLDWYICSGRASTPFIKSLLVIRPDVIARILVKGGSDREVVDRIVKRVENRTEAVL